MTKDGKDLPIKSNTVKIEVTITGTHDPRLYFLGAQLIYPGNIESVIRKLRNWGIQKGYISRITNNVFPEQNDDWLSGVSMRVAAFKRSGWRMTKRKQIKVISTSVPPIKK